MKKRDHTVYKVFNPLCFIKKFCDYVIFYLAVYSRGTFTCLSFTYLLIYVDEYCLSSWAFRWDTFPEVELVVKFVCIWRLCICCTIPLQNYCKQPYTRPYFLCTLSFPFSILNLLPCSLLIFLLVSSSLSCLFAREFL